MAEPARETLLHGTAIALGRRAVLIRGPSGAGKSDLALRCLAVAPGGLIATAPLLVADDQVLVCARDGRLMVRAPATLEGLLEVRGIGIVRLPCLDEAELCLVADIAAPAEIERLPEPIPPFECCGVAIERRLIAPHEASAPLKLLLALAACGRAGGTAVP